jgi:phage repressor protein C with HTH and peptisase S24 domain
MTYGKRLEAALRHANKSRSELAKELGCTPQTLGIVITWVGAKERKLSTDYHEKAAKFLAVGAQWLATGEGAMTSSLPHDYEKYLNDTPRRTGDSLLKINWGKDLAKPYVRSVKFKLTAGVSGFDIDFPEHGQVDMISFLRVWFDQRGFNPVNLFAIKVENASMEPGLFDGDTIVVNTASVNHKDGIVFAVNYEGVLVVKRLARDEGAWWLTSDNPDQRRYPRKRMTDDCFIIGEIVHKLSDRI